MHFGVTIALLALKSIKDKSVVVLRKVFMQDCVVKRLHLVMHLTDIKIGCTVLLKRYKIG